MNIMSYVGQTLMNLKYRTWPPNSVTEKSYEHADPGRFGHFFLSDHKSMVAPFLRRLKNSAIAPWRRLLLSLEFLAYLLWEETHWIVYRSSWIVSWCSTMWRPITANGVDTCRGGVVARFWEVWCSFCDNCNGFSSKDYHWIWNFQMLNWNWIRIAFSTFPHPPLDLPWRHR